MDIEEWLDAHENEMVGDIRKLVGIRSVARGREGAAPFGEGCAEAAGLMRRIAEGYGFETEDCEGRCVRVRFCEGDGRVEIWNHLDVVPEGEGWVYPPFGCERVGDFLIGRGVSDNKGPAVAVLYALRFLREQGVRLSYGLAQVCGLSEETGMEDAEWYVSRYGSPDLALVSDCRFPICCGEKGRCRIVVESAGPLKHIRELKAGIVSNSVAGSAEAVLAGQPGEVRLAAQGVAGHAAAPEKCVNPIGILAGMAEARRELVLSPGERRLFRFLRLACGDGFGEGLGIAAADPAFGRLSCAGTLLRFERGRASLEFDLRVPPSVEMELVVEGVRAQAKLYGLRVAAAEYTSGYRQDLGSPWVCALLEAYREVYGNIGKPYVMGGNTYARFFENAVGFGPGIPREAYEIAKAAAAGSSSGGLVRGAAVDGAAVDGTAEAGGLVRGAAVDEAAVDGTAVAGGLVRGAAVDGAAVDGTAEAGGLVRGAAMDEAAVDGTAEAGGLVDGAAVDGAAVDGAAALGLPPGHGGGHACDELQSVEGLRRAVKVYVGALQKLDKIQAREWRGDGRRPD